MIDDIPEELKKLPYWICHEKKVPKNPRTGRNLSGPYDKWGTDFETAATATKKYKFDGLGFVFKSDNVYCGIDIDKCVVDGLLSSEAERMVKMCGSYSEFSPSGSGVHIIVKNSGNKKISLKRKEIEVYSSDRYFTVSGNNINGNEIREIDVERVISSYMNPMPNDVSSLIEKIGESEGERFLRLWRGEWNGVYGSQSEADMALCSIIAKSEKKFDTLDRVFRHSGLFRPKWDRSVGGGKTYGQMTISKVLVDDKNRETTKGSIVVELDEFKSMSMPEIRTIMMPWLTFGSTHMIYAPRGAGKTFFAISLGLAVVHSSDFGDWELKESVNVLYVDGEMLPQMMKDRIEGLQKNLGEKRSKLFILSSGLNLQNGKSSISVAKPEWREFILEQVIEKSIKLMFLDNISALTPGVEENDSTAWDEIARWGTEVKQTGCSLIFIHHAGKGGQQRGTSAREDSLDTVISLKPTSPLNAGVDVDVIFEKSRHIAGLSVSAMNFKILSDPGSSDIRWEMGIAGTSKRDDAIRMMINGESPKDISTKLSTSRAAVNRYKKMAVEKGWLTEDNGKTSATKLGKSILNGERDEF